MSTPPAQTPANPSSLTMVHLKLLGMAALWGASWPAGRLLAQSLPPLSTAAWRFGLATALFVVWWLAARRGWAPLKALQPRQWTLLAAASVLGVVGYSVFFLLGLQQVPAARASLVVTLNPVVTTLVAAWLFRERFSAGIALGMAMAASGALWVLSRGEPWRLLQGGLGLGEWLLLGCVACWVGYTLLGRWLRGVDGLTTSATTGAIGGLMLLLAAFAVEGPTGLAAPLHASALVWTALAFLTAGATVLAYAWYFEGVARLGAGGASAYISLVPVFGVGSSVLLLGEALSASLLMGAALAVGGVVVMQRARQALG